jgi:DNA-binding response OmpR family regulator
MSTESPVAILVIDDEPDNLRLAVEMLRKDGLEILSARNGEDGLRIARHLQPALILLDVLMPEMDGFAVCRLLKGDPQTSSIPIIFLTALDQFEYKSAGFSAGGVDYITKPFDSRELRLRVFNQLRINGAMPWQFTLNNDAETSPQQQRDRAMEILRKARGYLLAHLADSPDLISVARHCATNRTTLQQLFQRYYGTSVFGFMREQRLQLARRLLRKGDTRVEVIALEVGYKSGRDLARAFRRRFGVAPTQLGEEVANGESEEPLLPESEA